MPKAKQMPLVLAAIQDDTSALGMTLAEIAAAVKLEHGYVYDTLSRLKKRGPVVACGTHGKQRYFASQERMLACLPAVTAYFEAEKERIKQRRLELHRQCMKRYYAKPGVMEREAERSSKRRKTVKPKAKAKKHVQKPLTIVKQAPGVAKKPPTTQWAQQEARITSETKVTICPSGSDNRFRVDPASVPRLDARLWAGRGL